MPEKPAPSTPIWRQNEERAKNQRVFLEELDSFLPDKILDFHVHVWSQGITPSQKPFSCGGHPLKKYDLEDLDRDFANAFPRRSTYAVCFGYPTPDYDQKGNDAYLAEFCDRRRFFPFRLFDPVLDTPDGLREDLRDGRFFGLKPYPDYVRKENVNDVEIREMLPDWAMEIVQDLGLLIMLHIPRKQRLADPLNQSQVIELCTRYPKARVILAHIGRAYYLKGILGQLENLKDLPNLYFDLTMVQNWEVLEYLFQQISIKKIIYGSDTPIALAPGKAVEINHQYTYVTPIPWHLSISDDHGKLVFTSFLNEEIRAIMKAAQRTSLSRGAIRRIFFENGMELLKEAGTVRTDSEKGIS